MDKKEIGKIDALNQKITALSILNSALKEIVSKDFRLIAKDNLLKEIIKRLEKVYNNFFKIRFLQNDSFFPLIKKCNSLFNFKLVFSSNERHSMLDLATEMRKGISDDAKAKFSEYKRRFKFKIYLQVFGRKSYYPFQSPF